MVKLNKKSLKGEKSPAGKRNATPGPSGATEAKPELNGEQDGENGENGDKNIRCKSLIIDGTKYRTQLNKKFENRKAWENPDFRKVTSSIPGTIVKIFVEEGQEVRAGEQMLIIEAMKMRNRILFYTDGKVKAIYVKEGERVSKNFLMLELE
jgi:biotin carboxyl carrier protein